MNKKITVVLAGNPNCGKTTIFNNLTGTRQNVGNYAGVTVEKKEGFCKHKGYEFDIVDLPGIYSLRATTLDEIVARNFLINENPDVIINVVDVTNLERNFYFSGQCLELGIPMVFAFNMYDSIEDKNYKIDKNKFFELLGGSPVVFTSGIKKLGMNELLDEVINVANKSVKNFTVSMEALHFACKHVDFRHELSDKIDKILLNKTWGLPIFFVIVWLLFKFTFFFSKPFMFLIERGLAFFVSKNSFITEAIIGGVGGVLVFIPVIFLLFFAISFLEGFGYMSRAAFLMDKFMHKIGLHGRSFIPMLLGFGCSVPAIMATRTIEDEKDRLTTMLIIPFMSCGARLPVYILIIGTFFPEKMASNILFSIYLLGVLIAILTAKLLRKSILKGESSDFVMELPPYRMPAIQNMLLNSWQKILMYIKKAGTIIFLGCIVIWFLSNFPSKNMEASYAGQIGKIIAPIFGPLGFDDWRISVSLIGGFVAKEIVVGTMGTLGATAKNPLAAYSLMVFVLLYVPCIAVLGVIRKETMSWKWPIFMAVYSTIIAWIVAFIIYQGGGLLISLRQIF